MIPDQAWQAILAQLQVEMPKASFDAWVRDTRVVSWADGTLMIGTHNAYARDWLESRLTALASRMLIGVMNQPVQVIFVVDETDGAADLDGDDEDGFLAEVLDPTRYRDMVHPERVVLLDGYVLRLLEQGDLAPREMSLWVGFRQAVYQRWKRGEGTVKNIPHWEVMRFAMMSRASYFRELSGRTSLAGGLVEVLPPVPTYALRTNRRQENANRYRVHMAPYLTRRDRAVLRLILESAIMPGADPQAAHKQVLQAMQELAVHNPSEYLGQDVPADGHIPLRVQDIVRTVLGLQGDIPADLYTASEKLFERITGAYGKVQITHYFLRVVASVLGLTHPQVWCIIMLRDRSWFDYETMTQKEFAIIAGGLDTLADWVGVTRKAVQGWFVKPAFTAFVRQADMRALDVPEHWIASNTAIFLVQHQEPLLGDLDPKMRLSPGKDEMADRKKWDSILEEMRQDLAKSETRLNNLIKPLFNPNKPQGITGKGGWDLLFLMRNNGVQVGRQHELIDAGALGETFAAWLMYAYTAAGSGLKEPVGFAIRRCLDAPDTGPGGALSTLATISPARLRDMLARAISGRLVDEPDFRIAFKGVSPDELRELFQRLFGRAAR